VLDPDTRKRLARSRELLEAGSTSIDRVARECGISPFHFIRLFAATFGVTPHQYRIAARLDRARDLLASGRCSVTEACLEVGFQSLGSFSTMFARRIGEPPSTYRRRAFVNVPVALRRSTPGCFGLLGHLPAEAFRSFREA
jgi:transcriptional regulator GlxA family with amidase domain